MHLVRLATKRKIGLKSNGVKISIVIIDSFVSQFIFLYALVGGCYVGSVGPNVLSTCQRSHCEPLADKVFIAGTESANLMIGYMVSIYIYIYIYIFNTKDSCVNF